MEGFVRKLSNKSKGFQLLFLKTRRSRRRKRGFIYWSLFERTRKSVKNAPEDHLKNLSAAEKLEREQKSKNDDRLEKLKLLESRYEKIKNQGADLMKSSYSPIEKVRVKSTIFSVLSGVLINLPMTQVNCLGQLQRHKCGSDKTQRTGIRVVCSCSHILNMYQRSIEAL